MLRVVLHHVAELGTMWRTPLAAGRPLSPIWTASLGLDA